LQFGQPNVPAAQPSTPVYGGATRTNFEQPASAAPTARGVQQYTVTGQDSYYSVAEKMYGNGALNKALYEYNRRNNPAADRLQVGGAMLIPDLTTLQAQFPDLVPSTSAASTATINPTPLQFPR
jgi:nucleoid-associated protein YgaU